MNKTPQKKDNRKGTATFQEATGKTEVANKKNKSFINTINIGTLFVFLITALYYLLVLNKNFLFKIQEYSLFLPDKYFFVQQMKTPGGLLSWLGTFLTQFFYYPWLGSTIFILLVLLVQLLTIKAYKIPSKYYSLTFIVSFALLLTITQLGYMILSIKSQGFIYSNLTGYAIALTALWGYKKLSSPTIRAIAAGLFTLVGYPLFGFYALLGTLLCCIREVIELKKDKQKTRLIPTLTGLAFITVVPYVLCIYFYTQVESSHKYIYGLPGILFTKQEIKFWIPYFTTIATLLLFAVVPFGNIKKEVSRFSEIAVAIVFLLSLYGFHHYSFNDENFRTELAMSAAIYENRWEDVLKLAKKQKDEPTRLIVMQTNLALQKLGRGGDEMFLYKNGAKEMNTPWPARLIVLAGKQMYYQYGQTNYCYHWCMEDMVERSMRVENLKYMVKCAIIKNEMKLAQKYNDILKQTLFHKDWAMKYQKYIDKPQSMLEDPEFSSLRPLTAYNDALEGNNDVLEIDLLKNFANSQCGTPLLLDISLQSTIILRNSELFWPRFLLYVSQNNRIPLHYQEAALFFSYFDKRIDIKNIKLDPKIVENFNQFIQLTKSSYTDSPERNKQIFAAFKSTYWFYYCFMENIKMH